MDTPANVDQKADLKRSSISIIIVIVIVIESCIKAAATVMKRGLSGGGTNVPPSNTRTFKTSQQ